MAANLTASVSGLTTLVANGGSSLTEEAWTGVDLLNLSAVRSAVLLLLDDPRAVCGVGPLAFGFL